MGISSPVWESPHRRAAGYQALCGFAVISLILGGLSPLVLIEPVGGILPAAGSPPLGGAVAHCPQCPGLAGRRSALGEWAFRCCFSPRASRVARLSLADPPRGNRVGDAWFAMLRDNQPQMAFQLTQEPRPAPPLDNTLAKFYATRPSCATPWPPTCGSRRCGHCWRWARRGIALDRIEVQERLFNRDRFAPAYTVSYEEGGRKKSFSVALQLTRLRLLGRGRRGPSRLAIDGRGGSGNRERMRLGSRPGVT